MKIMKPPVVVRRMRASDIDQVMDIERVSFSTPWTEATFHGLLRRMDSDLLVAECESELVGYAAFWTVLDQGELGNLAVSPRWRRQGVAKRLLEAVLERARERGIRAVFLEVRVSNDVAREMYEQSGFEEVARRKGYYSQPVEDAVVMRRRVG